MAGFKIKDATLKRWLKKYGEKDIHMNAKLMSKSDKKKPIDNPEAWMETALKDGFAKSSRCRGTL